MSVGGDNQNAPRKVFNSKLSILQPPEPRFNKEWPKKPPYWQIYGTPAAKIYWKVVAGCTVFSVFLFGITAYIQPKINLGIVDRYLTPELFYTGEEKEKYLQEHYERLNVPMITYDSYTRAESFEETTKEYRARLDSLDTALDSQKVFRSALI